MWDQRYDREDYLFGTEPALFLRRHAQAIPDGSRVLCIADGEGRNSVYLAQLGHRVTAFDGSAIALRKAEKLAAQKGVSVSFHEGDIFTWDWDAEPYDAVVGVFFQFMGPAQRAEVFAGLDRALTPGGRMLIHGYAPRQVEYGTGGPSAVENMYTLDLLREAFNGYRIEVMADYDLSLAEGAGHSGLSGLIDFVASKPLK